jgi:NAD(P)H-quinone oxidoreductase subunit 5
MRAALAAHKKFLFARLAEAALLTAILLLYGHHGTWVISEILAAYPARSLTLSEQLAALCLGLAALIKCAQLPVHGWLIQVVEAPTPVSALLHAGIINLGGYLLILFAPLFMQATAAQWLVLVVAGASAILAALVMDTRISIKVKLAWSTCAQMGLMLVECALGLFQLALLHLLAHSFYKAWSFLNSGSAVEQDLRRRLALPRKPTARHWLLAAAVAFPLSSAAMLVLAPDGPYSPWALLGAAMTVLIAERDGTNYRGPLVGAIATAALLISAYALQKGGMGLWVPSRYPSAGPAADLFVAFLTALLLAAHVLLRTRPNTPVARGLAARLYAGFYLDEWSTRATLRLWPVRLPERTNPKQLDATGAEANP